MVNLDMEKVERIKRETAKSVAENFGTRYAIYSRRSGQRVGKAKTLKGARRSVNLRDAAYGGYDHYIRDTKTGLSVF